MNLPELLRTRRSVRRFRADPPPDEILEGLIALATLAPSASNKQPWRFLVVQRRALIEAMAAAVRSALAEVTRHVPAESQPALAAYGDYFTRFEGAPTVIVPIARGHTVLSNLVSGEIDPGLRATITAMERGSGLVGASLALGHLLLGAHDAGLGASAMTGPLLAEPALRSLLEVPASWTLVALVALGYPDEAPPPTDRKPPSSVTRWIR